MPRPAFGPHTGPVPGAHPPDWPPDPSGYSPEYPSPYSSGWQSDTWETYGSGMPAAPPTPPGTGYAPETPGMPNTTGEHVTAWPGQEPVTRNVARLTPYPVPGCPRPDPKLAEHKIVSIGTASALAGRRRAGWRAPRLQLPRQRLAKILLLPVVLGAIATVALWAVGISPTRVHGLSDLFVEGGRITGLLGAYLLLLQVALMARIPWLERRIGSDWLTRAHRWLGSYLIALLVAHAVLLIVGLALLDGISIPAEAVVVIGSYPYVLMATVGLGLMIVIAASSAQKWRSRLSYETWHFAHLYAYLAMALAFVHQIVVGADFVRLPLAKYAWTGAHITVAACVIAYRVILPVALYRRHRFHVHDVVMETNDVMSIYVGGYALHWLDARAGQFFRWRFLTPYTWYQAHPFSLSAQPTERMLRLTVKVVGDHTRMLKRLRPGTPVVAEGPYGALTDAQRTQRRVLLLAGGIGITPVRALLEGLDAAPGDITVVYRGDARGAGVFARELEALAIDRGAQVHYLLGSRARCCRQHDPMSARRLSEVVPGLQQRDVYLCGSPGMIGAAGQALREAGVPARRIHAEHFEL